VADIATVADADDTRQLADELDEAAALDDDADKPSEEPAPLIDQVKLKAEIAELESYLTLARSIGSNAKGEKLVARLPEVLDEIEKRGGKRKAVIFTESVRTQKYLAGLLTANGYAGRLVLLNGSNSDPESQALYRAWFETHKGTDIVSGSRSADMKGAVVDAFRSDDKTNPDCDGIRRRGYQSAILFPVGEFRSAVEPATGGAAHRPLPSLRSKDRRDRGQYAEPSQQGGEARSRPSRPEI
jgi:hypothetical protein